MSRGQAQARTGYGPGYPSHYPGYGHGYYPGYGYGYYPSYGYGYYPRYGYGYSPWYGYGYGYPFSLSFAFGFPYFYDPYPAYGYGGGGGYYSRDDRDDHADNRQPTGSIRVRANPRHARVYIDGALVGTVDEFDGLGDHLEIEAGRHQIELRADGYESYSSEVSVRAGRTMTERANLKKNN